MRDPQFNTIDVWKLARAVVENHAEWDHAGSAYSDYDKYVCRFCDRDSARRPDWKILHDTDCPVLIAQDLLTGAPNNI